MKKILCLDFDGVCHSYTSKWKGPTVIEDPPVPGLKEFLERASEHFDIAVFSSRSKSIDGRTSMIRWFDDNGMGHIPMKFPDHKPSAFLTIDDRAFHFQGQWPNIEEIIHFLPWNKKAITKGG